MDEIVRLLRQAAEQLADRAGTLLLPDHDEETADKYPLGLAPGSYSLEEVSLAVRFLADMLEV